MAATATKSVKKKTAVKSVTTKKKTAAKTLKASKAKSTKTVKSAKTKSPSGKKRVKFSVLADKDSTVFLAGSFNKWNETKHKLKYKDGEYTTSILLPAGTHEYKFIINDNWCVDPDCSEWLPNEHGSLNSVKTVI